MPEQGNVYMKSLEKALQKSNAFLEKLDESPVGSQLTYNELKRLWDWNLPQSGKSPEEVIEELNQCALPGLNLNQSGRFFAWVIGGSHPSAIAADWLTSVWDQNAGMYHTSPSSGIAEEIAGTWLKQLLNIPSKASFAFVSGCQMANFTCLCAARNYLFHQAGWDIETQGYFGAPPIRIIAGDEKHSTISRALRMLGFGTDMVIHIPSDESGRIGVEGVKEEFAKNPNIPTLLILQAGEIHTGSFDDFQNLIPIAHQHKAWVHIDGAFGLWAAASQKHKHFTKGSETADSWSADGHKWLNVPYDSGYAFVANPDAHFLSFSQHASYLEQNQVARDAFNWNPELSRRARGFASLAAIKELGVQGIEDLVDRCCRHATEIVDGIGALPHTNVLARPVINQGVVQFVHPSGNNDEYSNGEFTEAVIKKVNESGDAFFQPSTFKGRRCMRISVSGWRTNEEDVKRTIAAVESAIKQVAESWLNV